MSAPGVAEANAPSASFLGGSWTRQDSSGGRVRTTQRARRGILSWRLKKEYLVYCLACTLATLVLLVWDIWRGIRHNWHFLELHHHVWEELLEVLVGLCIVVETALTCVVLGWRSFLRSWWCRFDLVVAILTATSVVYGLLHFEEATSIDQAEIPLLLVRFIVQPVRVLVVLHGTIEARRQQAAAEEIVDFATLELPDSQSPHGAELSKQSAPRLEYD
eukprot:TRINITY_DN11043_c0_g1_i2.p1 TRINITY_DN11043_c0_g1~~TRINITY_DN11043_c0_g1_i2.p1  ORF type:complete len:218 (-),score=34.97 TRINITY_DN11043_c0_g1_i2:306-959(-)